jgi:hypothetical protein
LIPPYFRFSQLHFQVPLFILQPLLDGWMFGHCASSDRGSGHGVAATRMKKGGSLHSANLTHAALLLRSSSSDPRTSACAATSKSTDNAAAVPAAAEALARARHHLFLSGQLDQHDLEVQEHFKLAAAAIDEADEL